LLHSRAQSASIIRENKEASPSGYRFSRPTFATYIDLNKKIEFGNLRCKTNLRGSRNEHIGVIAEPFHEALLSRVSTRLKFGAKSVPSQKPTFQVEFL